MNANSVRFRTTLLANEYLAACSVCDWEWPNAHTRASGNVSSVPSRRRNAAKGHTQAHGHTVNMITIKKIKATQRVPKGRR